MTLNQLLMSLSSPLKNPFISHPSCEMNLPQEIIDICFIHCDNDTKLMLSLTNKNHHKRYRLVYADPILTKDTCVYGFFQNNKLIKKKTISKSNVNRQICEVAKIYDNGNDTSIPIVMKNLSENKSKTYRITNGQIIWGNKRSMSLDFNYCLALPYIDNRRFKYFFNGKLIGNITGHTPLQAAKKVFSKIIQRNRWSGIIMEECDFVMKEVTKRRAKKYYYYHGIRHELKYQQQISIRDNVNGGRKDIIFKYRSEVKKRNPRQEFVINY